MSDDSDVRSAMDAGIAEANRRTRGEFDGLLGSLPAGASLLLTDILDTLRWVLLDKYSDEEVRSLLVEYAPMPGYRNVTPVPDDVELALSLLNLIASATRCEGDRFLKFVLGPSGLRDEKRQAGTRMERRPNITTWIERHLKLDPSAKSPALWGSAPDWLTDEIGYDRFTKRVTGARKRLAIGRK